MSRRHTAFACAAFLFVLCVQQLMHGQPQTPSRGRALGRDVAGSRGRPATDTDLPAEMGARHGAAAVAAVAGELEQKVRDRGGDPARYAAALAADASLWIDAEGQMLFVDTIDHDVTEGPSDPSPADPSTPTGPPPQPIRLLPSGLPIHHSKPGAPRTIFLDFDGATVRPASGGIVSRPSVLQGLTIDADPTTFNPDEQAVISRTWGRVAEDWVPFDVDVTTEEPAVIGSTVLWSIVGHLPAEIGLPPSVAGVSGFCLCYMPLGLGTPTFTFWGVWGATNHSSIADTITQENGHMFGLLHDGLATPDGHIVEYYEGHGTGATSWGPVMGAPLNRNVTQWSRGEYAGAVNPMLGGGAPFPLQDDIAIIAGRLGRRADDFGDTIEAALPLALPTTGFITSTSDVDVFALPRASDVRIEILPFRAGEQTDGGNLDVAADIVNGAGLVVASVDDLDATSATLTAVLPAGPHYLRVRPSFNPINYPAYDSLGQYTVTGTFVNVVRLSGVDAPLPAEVLTAGRTVPVKFTLTDAVAAARVQLWSDASPLAASVLAETSCKAQPGFRQHCNLKLPRDLDAATTYWIAMQYQGLDGLWVTAQVMAGGLVGNPLSFVAR